MSETTHETTDVRPRIVACVCTHRRNEPLRRLLDRLEEIAHRDPPRFALGVVVVDDNPDGSARPVVESFGDRFELGVDYRRSGRENISIARNLALETACGSADLVVMTDDDCVPEPEWIEALLETRRATGADAISGPMGSILTPGAPAWITRQEVFHGEIDPIPDGADMDTGQTNNSMLEVAWLQAHPEHRFDPALGRTGGEDMVFFKGAIELGLRSVHSAAARVCQVEPLEDLTLRALVRSRYWWGNSEAVVNLTSGDATRSRLLLRGLRRLAGVLAAVAGRIVHLQPPRLRASLVAAARCVGLVTGALGVRVRHH